MTDVLEPTQRDEALKLIDAGLGGLTTRRLVPSDEVTDLLLDVRALLISPTAVIPGPDN